MPRGLLPSRYRLSAARPLRRPSAPPRWSAISFVLVEIMPIACAAGTGALAGIAFAWIAGCMAAHAAPEPPRRPADVKADQPSSKPSSTGARTRRAGQIIVNDAAALRLLPSTPSKRANCVARLERLGPRIQPVTLGAEKNDSCVIEIPVRLTSLKLTEQEIEVSVHRPVLACGFAEQFGTWVRDLTAPFVQARLAPLKAVRTGPGSCAATVTIKPVASSAHAVGLA